MLGSRLFCSTTCCLFLMSIVLFLFSSCLFSSGGRCMGHPMSGSVANSPYCCGCAPVLFGKYFLTLTVAFLWVGVSNRLLSCREFGHSSSPSSTALLGSLTLCATILQALLFLLLWLYDFKSLWLPSWSYCIFPRLLWSLILPPWFLDAQTSFRNVLKDFSSASEVEGLSAWVSDSSGSKLHGEAWRPKAALDVAMDFFPDGFGLLQGGSWSERFCSICWSLIGTWIKLWLNWCWFCEALDVCELNALTKALKGFAVGFNWLEKVTGSCVVRTLHVGPPWRCWLVSGAQVWGAPYWAVFATPEVKFTLVESCWWRAVSKSRCCSWGGG